ncbi:DEAD/DEAH box helicase [Gordonia rhizosphera]|uniref:Putative ATP-dependent DNA helicase n=1 Tax=Gordonia rhizosphera NBRC 16068 TaxID=1108045 RepID=K6WG32_9ACTN|nr:DEAD/DEAH box helicase [Gordonia rhizosphera]GAB92726.1 putative ATP-dependent DNA helicase [Gordonia rhizosphera NBRC 16068]
MNQLRAWQQEALDKWAQLGHRAVVEAVTGSGKTEVGIAAVIAAVEQGRQALVVVPSRDLLRQWYERLRRSGFSGRVGRRGDGSNDSFRRFDVLISTVQSSVGADVELPHAGALLVADEVHRYGADSFSRVLSDVFEQRLGLTATFERSDDGIDRVLMPFFEDKIEGCTYRRGYDDGILAPVNVALVPVPFTPRERAQYHHLDEVARAERYTLISKFGCTPEPFGAYLQDVQALASVEFSVDPSTRSARRYLKAFADRRELLASVRGKEAALAEIAGGLDRSERTLVFAETKAAAASASETLLGQGIAAAPYTSDLSRTNRIALLETFKNGGITTLAAPRVLDEGIDVPEADVGIVLAASRTRRQMIQRMGRVIRPKRDGRPAVFIVMFAEGSAEDPDMGAHATFLEQLTEIAQKQIRVEAADVGKLIEVWLPETNSETSAAALAHAQELASSTTMSVTEQAVVMHRRAAQIRRGVVDATRFSRPEVLDILLTALLELEPLEAQILIHRFGLDGEDPRDIPAIATLTGIDADEVLRHHDAALLKVSLPDSESDFAASDPGIQTPSRQSGPSAQSSVGENSIAKPVDVLNGLRGARSVRSVGDVRSRQRSTLILDGKPDAPKQPFGLRHIQLPGKDGRPAEKGAARGVAQTVRIYMECEGYVHAGNLDTRTGKVTLEDMVKGRRDFDDPGAAARALVEFYDAPAAGNVDGWSMWKVKKSGEPISTLERELSKERHTKEGLHSD